MNDQHSPPVKGERIADETVHSGSLPHSYADEKKKLLNRLRRIEGQVRGIHKMIDDDRYCVDILNQLAAVNSAINKVSLSLLEKHTRGCVSRAIQHGNGDHAIQELMDVVNHFAK